jgi:hypothetical protein
LGFVSSHHAGQGRRGRAVSGGRHFR